MEETLSANKDGEVKNLLIIDESKDFLDDARDTMRTWTSKKNFNLVEIAEDSDDWLHEIQSRALFDKLNQPNSILLVYQYAAVNWFFENTPRDFLRDAALNRHYGCGNDWAPPDDLPNLLFVAAINHFGKLYWDRRERDSFTILHKDENKE